MDLEYYRGMHVGMVRARSSFSSYPRVEADLPLLYEEYRHIMNEDTTIPLTISYYVYDKLIFAGKQETGNEYHKVERRRE